MSVSNNNQVDKTTGAQNVLDYPHHEIHGGSHYTYHMYNASMASGDSIAFIVTTPNTTKWAHALFSGSSAFKFVYELYEDTTHDAGAAESFYNNNRNSSNSGTVAINTFGSGGSNGTLIEAQSGGFATGNGANLRLGGGEGRADNEWILKQNTKYLVRAESFTDANNIQLNMTWYEHTNK